MTAVRCELCPKACLVKPGQSGDCRARVNLDGKLQAVTYGFPCAVHVDPVEKKPLYHFLPGSLTFSLATAGCNLHCLNCQNWEISQAEPYRIPAHSLPPQQLMETAVHYKCRSISYTYTDPVIFYEYVYDTSKLVREAGGRNILVSAGYINRRPLLELCRYTDAATIDVKALSDKFYREICGGTLRPVLESLITFKETGVWLEVSHLIIPTLNDSDNDLKRVIRWHKENLGADTPLHFLRFFPRYRMRNLPETSDETLGRARDLALAEGLHYVYIGNLARPEWGVTSCPGCKKELIKRTGHKITENLVRQGKCPACSTAIAGVWK